ncbi:hypothetical protein BO70DRAFT_395426 [Aspergillus heteromorphus CBS 117.55]|uniref:Uncharacterized protein n=1 Tax=Aspergillus heteromorphus CBS 117.55 TaxID=1448321 RepID=A0A317WE45_9EURO|nr:uncharacterized protein BO70DRAFT_395426 [Aspergillus heteromorphus CBS 117.55]PWY84746.1 hypothetical protein BO70DRAFT_395426 [Aspergillus heteromorphus CBS 117.55]
MPVLHVNNFGLLYLFQVVYLLPQKSPRPTFVIPLGSIGGMEQRPVPSKAMLHRVVRQISSENESSRIRGEFPQANMSNAGARAVGPAKAFQTIEESVSSIMTLSDGATRQSASAQSRVSDRSPFP